MNALAKRRMTVDEFLAWAEGREGRWELADGMPVAMSPERALHGRAKYAAAKALEQAIAAAGQTCEAFVDCLAVRIDARTTFQPDVVVNCGETLDADALEAPDPVIVVEVLSPSTKAVDLGLKVRRYFELPSLHHYLILDPDSRSMMHYSRGEDGLILKIANEGRIALEPPGIELAAADLMPPAA